MGKAVLRIAFRLVTLAVLAGAGLSLSGCQPSMAQVGPPSAISFDKATIARGATLAALGDCDSCHTAPGGQPFAGGYPVPTPFGTIYGSNLTPDPATGIGTWSEAAFARAMRQGIARDGRHLYPAFPYPHFTRLDDQDIHALYAYLMSRPAVENRVPPPDLPFPLDIRGVMAGWNLLYLDERRFRPRPDRSAAWNRGAYLADGLGHCGDCHSPRNPLGAELTWQSYDGGDSEGWFAPALDHASPAPVPWTKDALVAYFETGFSGDHGIAAGPMAAVVRNLRGLPQSDIDALATYIASLAPPASTQKTMDAVADADKAAWRVTTAQAMKQAGPADSGAAIFAGTCASCHFQGGDQPFRRPVELGLSSVVNGPDPRNFIHIVMQGIQPPPGGQGGSMPPFGNVLNDRQIALLAQYVREHFTSHADWTGVDGAIAQIRKGKSS